MRYALSVTTNVGTPQETGQYSDIIEYDIEAVGLKTENVWETPEARPPGAVLFCQFIAAASGDPQVGIELEKASNYPLKVELEDPAIYGY